MLANYELGSIDKDFYDKYHSSTGTFEINWKILKRTYTVPEGVDWNINQTFDGDVHDVMVMLGFEDDWVNYFDLDVT